MYFLFIFILRIQIKKIYRDTYSNTFKVILRIKRIIVAYCKSKNKRELITLSKLKPCKGEKNNISFYLKE